MDPTDTISTIEAEKQTLAINSPYIVSAASVEAYRQKRRNR